MIHPVVCTVTVLWWESPLRTMFNATCNECHRSLGTFSKHESAMNWAQAHARSSKHIRG